MGIWWRFALVAFLSCTLWGAETRWIRLKSPNFEMYSTAGERNARETLKFFEQVRGFFVQGMGGIPGKTLPVRIVAFSSKKEYEPYRINNFATAFYHSTPTSDDIVLSQTGFEAFPVAVHEYVHLVARHSGLKLPPWLNEGLAELYSTMRQVGGEKLIVGDLIPGRFQALLRETWVPLAVIVAADRNSPYYNEKSQAGSLYNEGWALTHMLFLTTEYRPGFAKFVDLVNTGATTADALNKIYGKTIEQMDKELQMYLRGSQFKGAIFASKLEKVSAEIPAEKASAFDVKLVLADLQNRPGKEEETARAMEELTAQEPKRPEPFVTLGYLAWKAQKTDEAVRNFGTAFGLGYRDPTMLWDYGRLERGRNNGAAMRALSELMGLEPERLDVRMELAGVQLISKQPEAAIETLKAVKKVTPEQAPRLFTLLAHAQVDKDLLTEARVSTENLAKFAKTEEDKAQAEQLLKYLDARAAGPAAAPATVQASGGAEGSPPKLQRKSPNKSVAGSFVELDCSGAAVKMVIATAEGKKVFLIDDPHRVLGETIELSCGAQKKKVAVKVDYLPADRAGVDGLLRGIRFEH